jgi:hypothetical protein
MAGTLRHIAERLVGAVRPLASAFRDGEEFRILMLELGWEVSGLPPSYVVVAEQSGLAVQALEALADGTDADELLAVVELAGSAYRAVAALTEAPEGIDADEFLSELATRLFEYVLGRELLTHAPDWYAVLETLGIVTYEDHAETETRPAFGRVRFDWDQIPAILADPGLIPARVYGWGTPALNFPALAERIAALGIGLGLPASLDVLSREFAAALQVDASGPPERPPTTGVTVLVSDVDIGLMLTELPAEGSELPGLVLLPLAPDGIDERVDLGDGWSLTVRAGTDLAAQLGIVARPSGLSVRYPGSPGHPLPSAGFGATLEIASSPPTLLFGEPTSTRLEAGGARIGLALNVREGDPELAATVAVTGLALVVSPGGADSFLATVLGGEELRVELPLALDWSSRTGLRFQTGTGFEVTAYPGVDLGLVRFDRVDAALQVGGRSLALRATAAFSGGLGPFGYTVDRLGVELVVTFEPGNAGPFDVRFRPVWPTAVGLTLATPAASGGGFLRYDEQTGRYAGTFELTIVDTVSVIAIGLITTGPAGFTLLLMITADGFTPVQLGLGFTLTGIGGLVALNRTVDAEAVRGGLNNGVLDSVLFAKDPVANADRILSTLDRIFPAAPDRLLVGPLAEIEWGSPTIVKVRLALLLEIPQPIRAVLLAALSVLLPRPDEVVVELHVDAIGVLDLGRGELALDASLHHSRLWKYALTGDMTLRLNWGDDPQFLLSIGGFHPRFTPPAGLRKLGRMTLSLSDRDNPRIRFESYLAVTSNTIQFGARVALRAEKHGFGVDGGGAFDALVQWDPFGIDVMLEAWVKVFSPAGTLFGARLKVEVTGPQPWHVAGVLTIHLFFFSIEVGVNFTIGDPQPPPVLDTIDVLGLLRAELARPESWTSALPAAVAPGVTMRPAPTDGGLVVHPLGTVTVRQKVVPLGTLVTRYGAGRPAAGPRTYDLDVTSPAGITAQPLLDHFAPAQFTEQTEDEKLAAPSFALMPAGLVFTPDADGVPVPLAVTVDVAFETVQIGALG